MTPSLRPLCAVCGLNRRAEGSNRCTDCGPGSIESSKPSGGGVEPWRPERLTRPCAHQAISPRT